MTRCLFVSSRILGWRIFGRYVDQKIDARIGSGQIDRLDYGPEELAIPVPWFAKVSDSGQVRIRIRTAAAKRDIRPADYRALVFQGHDLAAAFVGEIKEFVGIIADTTPMIARNRLAWSLNPVRLAKRIGMILDDWRTYRPLFSKTTAFLVLSETTRQSLIGDYGVDPSRIHVVGLPVYDRIAAMPKRERPERPVILFVGNDFARKGGSFLLEVYRRYFQDSADLCIVSSRAPALEAQPGIRCLSNLPHEEVLKIMLQSHLFVFPSYFDELGLVLAEAASAGLPIVARESGGQSEYVHDGRNGFLLRAGDDPAAWRDAIEAILSDPERWQRFSEYGLRLASEKCTQARFDSQFDRFLSEYPG